MAWHQSLSNPLKVYDERHQQACIAESPELAKRIVEAVNGWPTVRDLRDVSSRTVGETPKRDREAKAATPEDFSFSIV